MATRTASARWRALSRSSDRGENREQGKAGGASRRPFSVRRAIGRKRAPVGAESAPRIPPSYPPSAAAAPRSRSEEHTSELQSLMRISYAVFCLYKNTIDVRHTELDSLIYI